MKTILWIIVFIIFTIVMFISVIKQNGLLQLFGFVFLGISAVLLVGGIIKRKEEIISKDNGKCDVCQKEITNSNRKKEKLYILKRSLKPAQKTCYACYMIGTLKEKFLTEMISGIVCIVNGLFILILVLSSYIMGIIFVIVGIIFFIRLYNTNSKLKIITNDKKL